MLSDLWLYVRLAWLRMLRAGVRAWIIWLLAAGQGGAQVAAKPTLDGMQLTGAEGYVHGNEWQPCPCLSIVGNSCADSAHVVPLSLCEPYTLTVTGEPTPDRMWPTNREYLDLSGVFHPADADLNGTVDLLDLGLFTKEPWDFDGDGTVGALDLHRFVAAMQGAGCRGAKPRGKP